MDEVEDTLKKSPLFDSLPPEEKRILVEEIFRRYLSEETTDTPPDPN
jgi:hypothetical protein